MKRELLKEMISRLGISKTISDFILLLLDKKTALFPLPNYIQLQVLC
ncbi:MAG: hypothetical protein MZV70_41395 [Desulfobacterales bacterium]|nr:hypothetical protein [Desulfobacterales bacterium]